MCDLPSVPCIAILYPAPVGTSKYCADRHGTVTLDCPRRAQQDEVQGQHDSWHGVETAVCRGASSQCTHTHTQAGARAHTHTHTHTHTYIYVGRVAGLWSTYKSGRKGSCRSGGTTRDLSMAHSPQYRILTSTSNGAAHTARTFLAAKSLELSVTSASKARAEVKVAKPNPIMVRNWKSPPNPS